MRMSWPMNVDAPQRRQMSAASSRFMSPSGSRLGRLLQRRRESIHLFALALLHDLTRLCRLRFRGRGVFRNREHSRCDARDFVRVVQRKKPVVEADVAPHETFVGLLVETADNSRNAA